MAVPFQSWDLTHGWEFKRADADKWLSVPRIPSNVHLDLMHHNVIPDPFFDLNELQCHWVADHTWHYRVTLPSLPTPANPSTRYTLAFDGLDTFCRATLNGTTVLKSVNMFVAHRVDITSHLTSTSDPSTPLVLELVFAPAKHLGREIVAAHPEHKWICANGEPGRLAVRKAQYHWGWDWGPELVTCGVWKGVRVESWEGRVRDVKVEYEVDLEGEQVSGRVEVEVEVGGRGKGRREGWEVVLRVEVDGKVVCRGEAEVDGEWRAGVEFEVRKPRLWWPRGYGEQALYEVTAELRKDGESVHQVTKKVGFRKGELVQEKDEIGRSFYFRFNGVDVFCGGSDWIPADSFTPRITTERYRQWLQAVVDGNQIMVRVWGGGIWEDDAFYDICDELRIIVWQDFMFACGNDPAYSSMLGSIEEVAIYLVKRLRLLPCLAIYAGNNEDYQIQEQNHLTYDYEDKDPASWLKTDFPARYIYEKLLPDIVAADSPHIPYHPGSPWGDGRPTSDPTVGDLHQWNVWHGTQSKYQRYDTLGGRFNSEFGLEAFPPLSTLRSFTTSASELYPQSQTLDFHNKADGHERRIALYVTENFRLTSGLERWVHLTQLAQAEALTYGYKGWRRQWGEGRRCGGALVWQLNDCWPGTSWSIVDYWGRKKAGWYAMKRALQAVAVGVQREFHDWSVTHARPARTSKFEVWVASAKREEVCAEVEIRFVSVATGKEVRDTVRKKIVRITSNGTTNVMSGILDNEKEEAQVIAARIWIEGELVARDVDWPQPYKYLDLSNRKLSFVMDGNRIHVKASKPTKGLVFEERDGVVLSDNAVDVIPGDPQTIVAQGIQEGDKCPQWIYLDMPEQ